MANERKLNFELLRIIAMFMVVILHYLEHTEILSNLSFGSFQFYTAWSMESFSIVAVNIYVLISGYFLVKSKFKIKKFLSIWLKMLVYSWGIFGLLHFLGLFKFTTEQILTSIFPLILSEYWFIIAYLLLYLVHPLLNKIIKLINKNQMSVLVMLILIFFSTYGMLPTSKVLGVNYGYSFIWFVALYFIAAYIRLYYKKENIKKTYCFWGYLVCVFALILTKKIYIEYNNSVLHYIGSFFSYAYNSFFVVIGSISLFLYFTQVEIKNKILIKIIKFFSPLTLGIYLIHEQIGLRRFLWDKISMYINIQYISPKLFVFKSMFVVFAVFISCALIDWICSKLFQKIENTNYFKVVCSKIEMCLLKNKNN